MVEAPVGLGGWLADVVEERGEAHDPVVSRGGVDGPQRVVPQVLAGHLVLRHAALRRELRDHDGEQARVGRQPQPGRRPGRLEQSRQLRTDSLSREVQRQLGVLGDGRQRGRFDRQVQRCRQPDRADHAQGVLVEPSRGVADRPQAAGREVAQPVERIDEPARKRIGPLAGRGDRRPAPGHGVDREVPSGEVLGQVVPELHAVGPAVVRVLVLDPEGRDLEDPAVPAHGHGPEAVLVDGPREQLDDLGRSRVGGKVPIGRRAVEQRVAQRTADDVGRVPVATQPVEDRVHGRGDLGREACRRRRGVRAGHRAWPQFRPRKRYILQASFRSSWRYGVNSE